ncbi:hypothetical protein, partial [Pseudokineococcus sp. 1T1Z-3]|uniref:hypothetical protein n=1 Tax=Pseudokineococcus sp. 1T1Z-3 TaxID=3132745 RepID=UPI0030A81BF0
MCGGENPNTLQAMDCTATTSVSCPPGQLALMEWIAPVANTAPGAWRQGQQVCIPPAIAAVLAPEDGAEPVVL